MPPPPAAKLMVVPLFKVMMPPRVALPATLPPALFMFTARPVAMIWLACPPGPTPLASSAVTPPPNGGLMADPLWKMIWPPVCAEAAVAQLPLMLDPELKVMVPLVSARPPMLPPLNGFIVTLLVVICAPVVAWTPGLPLSVVLGAMAQDPVVSVTVLLPETVQV
jgi:hypothetical protein